MRAQHERPVHNRRAPTPRRRSLRVYPWLLCLCALCVGAALIQAGRHCFDGAGFLAVADIRICGCSHIPPARVLEMISIRKGQNIFTIDLIAESRRLERDPWIYRAIVKRTLPNAIDVQIIERHPVAVIKQGDFYLIDNHAEIFKSAAEHERIYPLLTWANGDLEAGTSGAAIEMIAAALRLIATLQETGVRTDFRTTIEMSKDFGLTLTAGPDSPSIYFGFGASAEKLRHAALILSDLTARGLTAASIHLGMANKAYVRLHEVAEQTL